MFSWLHRKSRHSGAESPGGRRTSAGFYSVQDPYGSALDDFDRRFGWDDGGTGAGAGAGRAPRWQFWRRKLADTAAPEPGDGQTRNWWRASKWRWFMRGMAALLALFILLVAWLALTAPLSKSLEPIAPPQITLVASDGTPIARSGAVVEAPVEVAKLPAHVIEPFLAIEDRRFYDHWGVDPRGLARAAFANATGGSMQGGSTITQQLAKFTFLTPEQTLTRKAREMLIAFWLEAWLTKDEILERYLSNAYFGDNQYGLRAASLHYFYRQPEKLRPEQAAMLAGLLKAPSRLAPTNDYTAARDRMRVVVQAMVAANYLTQAQADAMPTPRLDVRARNTVPTGTYFADWALPLARKNAEWSYAKQTITTTLDARLQGIASRVVSRAGLGGAQVALVAMRPDGEVVAMIGGRNYAKSPFNRATQARRQPGSTFKLFVYLAALEAGMEPDDVIDNRPITQGSYRPKNSGNHYSDTITLEDGFARSSNVAAVRLFEQLGSTAVIRTARDLGVKSALPEGDPSLALGTSTMTLLELTSAYAGVAGNSYPVVPHAFPQEEKSWFDRLMDGKHSLSGSTHKDMERLLRAAINRGTGRAATLSVANYGKTGTTQDHRDALFVGYAGDLVVGVWVGNDDNSPLNGVSGGGLPARIWRDFMSAALKVPAKSPPAQLPDPEGPIQPLDIPEIDNIPLGDDGSTLNVSDGEVTVSTRIDGVPVDFRLTEDGLEVEPAGAE